MVSRGVAEPGELRGDGGGQAQASGAPAEGGQAGALRLLPEQLREWEARQPAGMEFLDALLAQQARWWERRGEGRWA